MAGNEDDVVAEAHRRSDVMQEAIQYAVKHVRSREQGRLEAMLQEISDQVTAQAREARRAQQNEVERGRSTESV